MAHGLDVEWAGVGCVAFPSVGAYHGWVRSGVRGAVL